MNITDSNFVQPVYDDFRKLITLKESARLRKRRWSRLRRLSTWCKRRIAFASCVCLLVGGFFALVIHQRIETQAASVMVSAHSVEATRLVISLPAEDPASPMESFDVRVASFRDSSNAERMAEYTAF